jgi:hypothetical protein
MQKITKPSPPIFSKENPSLSIPIKKKRKLKKKFQLKPTVNIQTSTKPKLQLLGPLRRRSRFQVPLFENTGVLFLKKNQKQVEKENDRKITSVDVHRKGLIRKLNSKTSDISKKQRFKNKFKKKLKIKLEDSVPCFQEIPTIEREIQDITRDTEK